MNIRDGPATLQHQQHPARVSEAKTSLYTDTTAAALVTGGAGTT